MGERRRERERDKKRFVRLRDRSVHPPVVRLHQALDKEQDQVLEPERDRGLAGFKQGDRRGALPPRALPYGTPSWTNTTV